MRPVRARTATAKAARSGGRGVKSRVKTDTRRSDRAAPRAAEAESGTTLSEFIEQIRSVPIWRRPMLLVTLGLVVIAGAAGLFAGGQVAAALTGIDTSIKNGVVATGFALDRIAITGNERTSANDIYEALNMTTGESIFGADPAAARERLIQLPWVSDAVVRRRFPDSINVTIYERRPFAVWQNGETLSVVERSGAVIRGQRADDFAKLPLLFGAGAPQMAAPLIDALSGQRAISARLRGAERVSERRWDLILDRGVRVRLPETGWEAQLEELERLIVDRGILERDVEIIDLRYPENYIFQLHNGDSRPVSRERPA